VAAADGSSRSAASAAGAAAAAPTARHRDEAPLALRALDGLRALSSLWIMLFHAFFVLL
jgi:peptidoglycan/LPS O-acetylase OafA/YrhL